MTEMVVAARRKLESGALSEAEALCQHILARDEDAADAWQVLGLVAQRRGDADSAISHMRQAVAVEPRSARRRMDLAQVAMEVGAYYDAVAHLEAVVAGCGDVPSALHQLGQALLRLGHPNMACDRLERSVNADPENARAWSDLGQAYLEMGRNEAALAALEAGLKLTPYDLPLHLRIARTLQAMSRPDQAAEHLRQLPDAYEHDPRLFSCQGDVLLAMGDLESALEHHGRAVALAPHDPETQHGMAQAELSAGQLQRGFRRLATYPVGAARPSRPPPALDNFAQGPLRIHAGDDLGTAILLARYIPLARTEARKITLHCLPAHKQLLHRALHTNVNVCVEGSLPGASEPTLDLRRLPGLLDADLVPEPIVLRPDEALVAQFQSALRDDSKINVGLCWQGSDAVSDRRHAMHLSRMLLLMGMNSLNCVSLQRGSAELQADALPPSFALRRPTRDALFRERPADALAAAIAAMDHVVTVDGDVAHLAATLGKPTWLLLASDPTPLWGHTERKWYRDVRLFRQERAGDFGTPIRRLRAALRNEIESESENASC